MNNGFTSLDGSIPSVKEMRGFIKSKRKRPVSKAEMKEAVMQGILEKFERKRREGNY